MQKVVEILQDGGRVKGVVRAEKGGGQAGAEVLLRMATFVPGAPSFTAHTGVDGAFDFRHVPAGDYTIMVVAINGIDFRSTQFAAKGIKPKSEAVKVSEGGQVDVTL